MAICKACGRQGIRNKPRRYVLNITPFYTESLWDYYEEHICNICNKWAEKLRGKWKNETT